MPIKKTSSNELITPCGMPGILYVVRWLEPPRLWKQSIEKDKQAALDRIATIQEQQGKPGPYKNARFFKAYFAEEGEIPGRRGPTVGRYLIKWKKDPGLARMEVAYTWEEALAARRRIWVQNHRAKGFWLNPNIHVRLS